MSVNGHSTTRFGHPHAQCLGCERFIVLGYPSCIGGGPSDNQTECACVYIYIYTVHIIQAQLA